MSPCHSQTQHIFREKTGHRCYVPLRRVPTEPCTLYPGLLCLPQGASRIAADEGNGAAVIGLEVMCRKPGDQSKSRFPWLRRKGGKGVRGRVWADNSSQHRSPLQVDPSQQEAEAGMRSARLHRSHVRAPHRALPALPLPSACATKSPNSPSSATRRPHCSASSPLVHPPHCHTATPPSPLHLVR